MFWLNHIIYILDPDKKEYMIYKVLKGMASLPLGFFGRLVSQVIAQIYLLIKLLRSSHCIAFWCMIWPIPNYATLYLRRLSLAFVRSLIPSPSQLDPSCVVPVVRNGKPSFFFSEFTMAPMTLLSVFKFHRWKLQEFPPTSCLSSTQYLRVLCSTALQRFVDLNYLYDTGLSASLSSWIRGLGGIWLAKNSLILHWTCLERFRLMVHAKSVLQNGMTVLSDMPTIVLWIVCA